MNSFAIAVSMMNVRAYGIAAIYPAADKSENRAEGPKRLVDMQKQNFEMYLADQYRDCLQRPGGDLRTAPS